MCSVDVMVNKTNYKFGKQTVPVLFICVRDQPEYPTHIHSHTKIKLGFHYARYYAIYHAILSRDPDRNHNHLLW